MFDNIKAFIFDVDGTLVDSMWIWKQVDIEFLGRRCIELPQDLQKGIEGLSYTETAMFFKDKFNLPDSIEDIKEEWRVLGEGYYRNKVNMKTGAKEFLKKAYDKGIKIGIATSNSSELVSYMMERHGIRDYFQAIRTSCEVPRGKPYPDVYLKVAEDLGVKPSECFAFEDTVAGSTAAKSAGMRVIVIEDEFSICSKQELLEICEKYIKDYNDVIRFV